MYFLKLIEMNRKIILSVLVLFILWSCSKENDTIEDGKLKHVTLGFELDEPNIILNEFANGKLDRDIKSVLKEMFDEFPEPAVRYWEFDYLPDSDQVSEMRFFQTSEITTYKFYYNTKREIDSIVSNMLRPNSKKLYTFNYNTAGVLKSVFMDSEYSIEENYFGYYPNGKIKEIYNSFRGNGSSVEFSKQVFYYDSTFKNVIKLDHTTSSPYNYSYEYIYDNHTNPYKGFLVAASVILPNIGRPANLSENNILQITKIWLDSPKEVKYNYVFNYEDNRLVSYSDEDTSRIPFILYSINK